MTRIAIRLICSLLTSAYKNMRDPNKDATCKEMLKLTRAVVRQLTCKNHGDLSKLFSMNGTKYLHDDIREIGGLWKTEYDDNIKRSGVAFELHWCSECDGYLWQYATINDYIVTKIVVR